MVRIRGSFTAERCSETISNKLNEFGINFVTDIVAVTIDGCSMMKKLGKLIPVLHQLCYANGLQLVIHYLFYQKQTGYREDGDTEEESDFLSETDQYEEEIFNEMEDSDGLSMEITTGNQQANSLMLKHDIYGIVNKVSRIVKIFKRSPLKNEILQNYAKENIQTDCSSFLIARPICLHSYTCSRGLLS